MTPDWQTYRCRIRPTRERDLEALQERLRHYLAATGLEPGLAEDPRAAAQAIMDAGWAVRPFQWFPWLDRRLNRRKPPRLV